MTKSELLASMVELGACSEARDYVSQHASDDALTIGLKCERAGWLIWYIGRRDPLRIAAFARRCADRCGSQRFAHYARISLDYASAAYAASDYDANYAAAAANYAAAVVYVSATVAERNEQLRDLHEMWIVLVGGEK